MSMSLVDVEINDNSSQKCLTAFVACIRGKWLFALLKHVHRAAKASIANVNLECCENREIFTGIDFGITAKEKASAKRNTQSQPAEPLRHGIAGLAGIFDRVASPSLNSSQPQAFRAYFAT
ncbi:hypothetical protein BDEG_21036 [Batrachochytrium dendrobatidis JEL423]|uniref:Uncharacterized protein n=1 Tax=Batrachochytrium dendrobatidis (strain JEL423) TaxID=403673 RepID=A0A177WA09_BATDL|nr:hypothetical protein BDEG_21036 [Batrachochytrium dendrobatidis JEL423]